MAEHTPHDEDDPWEALRLIADRARKTDASKWIDDSSAIHSLAYCALQGLVDPRRDRTPTGESVGGIDVPSATPCAPLSASGTSPGLSAPLAGLETSEAEWINLIDIAKEDRGDRPLSFLQRAKRDRDRLAAALAEAQERIRYFEAEYQDQVSRSEAVANVETLQAELAEAKAEAARAQQEAALAQLATAQECALVADQYSRKAGAAIRARTEKGQPT